jgi:periplasmic protein TonB
MANKLLLGLSLAVHGGLAVLIGQIEVRESRAATAIEIAETQQKRKQKPPPPPAEVREPPRQVEKRATPKLAARAAEPPPLSAPANPAAALAALPDFGLTLSGGDVGGVAVAQGAPAAPGPLTKASGPIVKRALAAAVPLDDCSDPPAKPKPTSVPQPSYTDQARAAGIEGKVRVELTVDESGRVVSVRVISGLGYGLDVAAVAAAQRASFQPAIRCGKPARATFTISMRFAAS